MYIIIMVKDEIRGGLILWEDKNGYLFRPKWALILGLFSKA